MVADATATAEGTIRVDRDGVPVARIPARIEKGRNTFVLSQKVETAGFFRYRAVLETERDTDARNNVGIGFASVRESGVGFRMIGGEGSFLPGGYYGTPLADVLPVDMDVRQRKNFPSTTILIVCDTSGSMSMIEDGQMKVKVAASAVADTVRMLTPLDHVGVAGSTDRIAFVSPVQPARNKDAIVHEIGRLAPGGRRHLHPPLAGIRLRKPPPGADPRALSDPAGRRRGSGGARGRTGTGAQDGGRKDDHLRSGHRRRPRRPIS